MKTRGAMAMAVVVAALPDQCALPREIRDSLDKLRKLPMVTERGARLVLSDVAALKISDGPPMLRSENARLSGWVYVDIRGRDLRSAVQHMQRAVGRRVKRPHLVVSCSQSFERGLTKVHPRAAMTPNINQTQVEPAMVRMLAPNTLSNIVNGRMPRPVAQIKVHHEMCVNAAA